MANLRRHLTYANVMSTIAVFLLLGGATAWAASKIGPDQLKAGAVTTGKLAEEAVKSGKIAKDAVTGNKVNESTLGTVPKAEEATTLGGIGPTAFTRVASSSGIATVREAGTVRSLTITAPSAGYLFAVASANVSNGGTTHTFSLCRLNVDGSDVPTSVRDAFTSEDVPQTECVTHAVVPVTKGPHAVSLTFQVIGSDVAVENPELDVAFIQLAG